MAKRNAVISICKGIGIILMVIGHAEAPELLTNCIYTFHMPLFFIAAGYFFSRRYLDDPWSFCVRRVRGLYVPFVKWSLIYLLLHNLWFEAGVLNESYGNWTGGVTHPYTWHEAMQRLVMIITGMSGYDEFMAGAFWFFRALLIASIGFLVLLKLVEGHTPARGAGAVATVMVITIGFIAFRIANGLTIKVIPNGGLRECWGLFFFGAGVLIRRYEGLLRRRWPLLLLSFLFILCAGKLHTCGMNNSGKMINLLTLPLTGCVGFLMIYWLAGYIDATGGRLRRMLCYVGDNTLYVLVLHIPAYKIVSLLKIHYYGLDPAQIGCHMVIHYNNTDFFWPLYTLAGVGVPLLLLWCARRLKKSLF